MNAFNLIGFLFLTSDFIIFDLKILEGRIVYPLFFPLLLLKLIYLFFSLSSSESISILALKLVLKIPL